MFKRMKRQKRFMLVAVIAAAMLVISCGPKAVKPTSEMDDPRHHTNMGIRFLNEGNIGEAQKSFERAIQLNPNFSMATTGLGVVKAYQNDFKAASGYIDRGWNLASTSEEKVFAYVGYIRLYTLSKDPGNWLNLAREKFDFAVQTDSRSALPHYFMGMAYKAALEFDKAEGMFAKVLDLKGEYTAEANAQWELIQKIKRAMPGTLTGKKIAIVDKITRADTAALFMEELKIDKLYERRTAKRFDTSFKDPDRAKMKPRGPATASDIADSPLRSDIEGILRVGVRGLEVNADGTFDPLGLVKRGPYAMMIEDILIRVTGDEKLATQYIGGTSTFPDLRSDLPYFNAVMVVTSRGIMKGNIATGQFDPEGTVSGVDALLIIREFKEQLNFR